MGVVEPGFHLRYAHRLAWRYRLLCALFLALLGLLHPLFALLSPLALLLPARLWEGEALRAIARVSLAYPTALRYGEERLWREARKVAVPLPPFPYALLLLYLLALLLALGKPWAPGEGGVPFPHQAPRVEQGPREGQAAGQAQGNGAGRMGEQMAPGASPQGEGAASRPPEGTGGEGKAPAEPQASPSGGRQEGARGQGGPGQAMEAPSKAQGGAEGASPTLGEGPARRGQGGAAPKLGGGQALEATPKGPGVGLLSPGEGPGDVPLPSPWPEGAPPERVQRGVEVYLERTPLPPESRELLRRYFGP